MSHIDNICKHLSKDLFLFSQLRHYVDGDTRKNLSKRTCSRI